MLVKNSLPPSPVREYRKEIEYLYARLSVVDELIESLQAYDRFRGQSELLTPKRKSA
jgi:hypothetical protein